MRSRRTAWITLGLAVAVATAGALVWRARRAALPRGEGFNVILISIDTLRADHLGCYGHPNIKTPNIDRLAAGGTLFEQCTCSCPLTLPSHATMLTGTHPFVHGARDNGEFYLHEDNVSLAEVLQQAGYATAAEVAAYVLNREFGIDQGFDVFNDVSGARRSVVPDPSNAERKADEVCASAIQLLQDHAGERFFLLVHFYDPHFPYEPPPPYAAQYRDPYVGEIAYTDAQVGRFLDELRRMRLEEKTLVILVGDHGEGRAQHGEESHGTYVYDSTLSVPLIFYCPGKIPAGRRVAAQVRLVDIAPTVVSFLGMPPMAQAQGTDLLPLVVEPARDPELAAYGESMQTLYSYGYAPLRALRKNGWKYIHAPQPQLYHVSEDPAEERNLAAQQPERVAQMRAELRALIADAPVVIRAGAGQRETTPEDVQKLAALGYVGSDGQAAELAGESELDLFDVARPDPHDHVEEIALTMRAMVRLEMQRFDEVERILRELLARRGDQPGFHWAYKNMAFVLSRRGRHAEALEYYRKALELRPDTGTTLTRYAMSLSELGRIDEALLVFERALRIKPTLAHTYQNYAIALALQGRADEAVAQSRRAIEMEPENADARVILARIHLKAGRVPEAIGELRNALDLKPDAAEPRRMLADLLLREGRAREARMHLETLLQSDPGRAATYVALADACMRVNQAEQARRHLRRALGLDPKLASAWHALAFVELQLRQAAEARAAFEAAVAADPDNPTLANDLAWLLATSSAATVRDGTEALRLARAVGEMTGGPQPNFLDTLAAALAEVGRFEEAVGVADEAIRMAEEAGSAGLARQLRERRELYINQKPYRMTP